MRKDRRGEAATGFASTSQTIGFGLTPDPTASQICASSTTVKRIQKWTEQQQLLNVRFPDMDTVLCVFTGNPIGEENALAFVRCREGNKKETRIVMCLASCKPDPSRYEVLPIEKGGFGTFKTAVLNMTKPTSPIDRSLYY